MVQAYCVLVYQGLNVVRNEWNLVAGFVDDRVEVR